jgi:transcriptional regulator with XRE-family HTH domain
MIRLNELRKSRGESQNILADYLGVARATYSRYETGDREPDFATLQRLADFYDVTTDYLLGRTDDPSPPGAKEKALPEEEGALALQRKLIEVGYLKDGQELTDEQVAALVEFAVRNMDFIRARAQELKKLEERGE